MRSSIVIVALLAAAASPVQRWSLASQDGRTAIDVARTAGRLTWHVSHAGATVLVDSLLGIRRAEQSFVDGLRFVSASGTTTIDERYQMPHGKRHDHHVQGRERTLVFANGTGARLEVVLRAHDDGVAFRYRFPGVGKKTLLEELTGFHL